MESNHFDLKAKRRMLYKRKKIRKLLKLSLTSFFSLAIVIGIASSYIKNNTNIKIADDVISTFVGDMKKYNNANKKFLSNTDYTEKKSTIKKIKNLRFFALFCHF